MREEDEYAFKCRVRCYIFSLRRLSYVLSCFTNHSFPFHFPTPLSLLSILVRNDAHPRKVLKILNVSRTSQKHPIFRDARLEGKTLEPLRGEGPFHKQAVDLEGREGVRERKEGIESVDGHAQE